MPVPPSVWLPGPLSPQQLNTDLVSFDGTGFTPNGVVFHSHRTILYETVTTSRALGASTSGSWSTISGTGTSAFSVLDTAALYGSGADSPGVFATFEYTPTVNGSGGQASIVGGYFLSSLYATSAEASGTPAACGAGISSFAGTSPSVLYSQGAIQAQGTGKTGCAPWLDLIDVVSGTQLVSTTYAVSGTWIAPAGVTTVQAQCWAGGGGGGGATGISPPSAGLGGGGGEYAANSSYSVVPGNTYTFIVGAAGTGGVGGTGGNGGNTIFDTTGSGVIAHGGTGGSKSTTGQGGSGSTAPVHYNGGMASFGGGGSGGTGSAGNSSPGFTGAPAVTGGGPGGDSGSGGNGSSPASGPGGGGGGADSVAGASGGAGWEGQITLSWLVPGSTTFTWQPAAFVLDSSASSLTPPADSTDTAGITSRALFAWAGVTSGGTTVTAVPTPQQTWPVITSTLLNGTTGPSQALTFLNNPPLLRVTQALATSISNNTNTTIFSNAATVVPDTYSGWNGANTYTAVLPGLYLAAPTVTFSGATGGQRYCGISVNGTAATLQGPSYYPVQGGSSNVTSVTQLRVLDLQAGDTVSVFAYQNSGGSLALSSAYNSRLVLAMLCPLGTGSGALSATPPDTSFRWSAGLSPSQLPSLLNLHLGNDLSFLVNRPYFTGYQGTAQSGFANNSWNAVTVDTVGGLIHGSSGDNYAGWNATNNAYAAQQPGWYLVISEVFATAPGLTTGYVTAGIQIATSGGIAPSISPDYYQSAFYPLTTGTAPGASAVGLYYLSAGETISPVIRADSWTAGTWGTTSSASVRSQFTVVWMCE